ncbi:hypothetical protein [Bradyrhizobium brasilense]|uniref:hypothetical protein n=1 Tax=Bradyrhizobium brasilense TaxID=1419277 RepID=UPI00115FA7D7|nr:hypothetical protein [Bradyrhizobium brasilense]
MIDQVITAVRPDGPNASTQPRGTALIMLPPSLQSDVSFKSCHAGQRAGTVQLMVIAMAITCAEETLRLIALSAPHKPHVKHDHGRLAAVLDCIAAAIKNALMA